MYSHKVTSVCFKLTSGPKLWLLANISETTQVRNWTKFLENAGIKFFSQGRRNWRPKCPRYPKLSPKMPKTPDQPHPLSSILKLPVIFETFRQHVQFITNKFGMDYSVQAYLSQRRVGAFPFLFAERVVRFLPKICSNSSFFGTSETAFICQSPDMYAFGFT